MLTKAWRSQQSNFKEDMLEVWGNAVGNTGSAVSMGMLHGQVKSKRDEAVTFCRLRKTHRDTGGSNLVPWSRGSSTVRKIQGCWPAQGHMILFSLPTKAAQAQLLVPAVAKGMLLKRRAKLSRACQKSHAMQRAVAIFKTARGVCVTTSYLIGCYDFSSIFENHCQSLQAISLHAQLWRTAHFIPAHSAREALMKKTSFLINPLCFVTTTSLFLTCPHVLCCILSMLWYYL